MRDFMVDLPLRVVWSDMAVIAGFRLAGLFQAEFMPDMAGLAVSDRTILRRFADIVAGFAGKRVTSGLPWQPEHCGLYPGQTVPSGMAW